MGVGADCPVDVGLDVAGGGDGFSLGLGGTAGLGLADVRACAASRCFEAAVSTLTKSSC